MEKAQRRTFWPFLTPALVLFVLFFVAPIVYDVWLSFHSWDGISAVKPRGFKNFRELWNDPVFTTALKNTALILFVGGAIVFLVSFGITMLLREMAAAA